MIDDVLSAQLIADFLGTKFIKTKFDHRRKALTRILEQPMPCVYEALLSDDLKAARSVMREIGFAFDPETEPHLITCQDDLRFMTDRHVPCPVALLKRITKLRALNLPVYAFVTAALLLVHLSRRGSFEEVIQIAVTLEQAPLSPCWLMNLPTSATALNDAAQQLSSERLVELQQTSRSKVPIDWQQQLAAAFGD